jgi:SRSO17 transposase
MYRGQVSEGFKGHIVYEFTRRKVVLVTCGNPGTTLWFLIRRTLGEKPEYAYFISNASAGGLLKTLFWLSGLRCDIEKCFEETKTGSCMDHYEVQKFPGWHHHMLTCMLLTSSSGT